MMYKILIAIFFPLILMSQDLTWDTYENDAFQFSIYVPCELESKSRVIETVFGEFPNMSFYCEGTKEDPNELYMMSIIQYSEGLFPEDSIALKALVVDSTMMQITTQLYGELSYNSAKNINGVDGEVGRIVYNGGDASCKLWVAIHQDVLYVLQVFMKTENGLNDGIDQFLNSFRLKRREE